MPVTKQAIKKVRQDRRKTTQNAVVKKNYKKAVAEYRKKPEKAKLSGVYKALDTAAKTNVIHKNKAARLKSRLNKMLSVKAPIASVKSNKPKNLKTSKGKSKGKKKK